MLNHYMAMSLDIDIVVIVLVYLLAYRSETGAGIFALGQGLLMDIFSGGIWGLYTLLYLIIFLFIKIVSRPFALLSVFGQVVVIFMAVLVKDVLMISLLYIFSLNMNISYFDFLLFMFSALCSGLIAPFIFYLLNLLSRFFHEAKEEI
jgi:rod shape-determining protein MreD